MKRLSELGRLTAEWFYRMRRRFATAAVTLLTCVLAYHVVFGANGMMVYQHKRAEFRSLQQQFDAVQRENRQLEQQIKALKTDPRAIEKEAREQLRYTRPGEKVYLLPEPPVAKAPVSAAANRP